MSECNRSASEQEWLPSVVSGMLMLQSDTYDPHGFGTIAIAAIPKYLHAKSDIAAEATVLKERELL